VGTVSQLRARPGSHTLRSRSPASRRSTRSRTGRTDGLAAGVLPPPVWIDAHVWKRPTEEAERELDAAKRLSEVRAAAKKLTRAKAEGGWLEEEEKPKQPTRGEVPAEA
jgi:hypothetical protein